jgi:hypothetical protein
MTACHALSARLSGTAKARPVMMRAVSPPFTAGGQGSYKVDTDRWVAF